MKFNLLKFRMVVMLFSLLFISGLFVASFQNNISKANSFIASIIVNLPHLDFGLVFPGEQPQKTFTVSYSESESGDGDGSYTITEKYKPLPGAVVPSGYIGNISDYCQDNFNDFDRCYKTLCPFIEEFSEEDEGDTVLNASVSLDDPEDLWVVAFNKNFVPAVIGNVSQDHKGDIISESGIYGCDLSFNVDVESHCGDGNLDPGEECDEGINNSDEPGSTCSTQCMRRDICENADVIIDLDPVLWVVGENCHSSNRIQDSVNINIPRTAQGEVYGQSNRGNIGQEQTNESFYLEINGTDGLVSLDDLDPVAVTTRFENLGNFPFTAGSQTVYMNTNAQCPPDIHANSVELDKLCIYLDPDQEPYCGDGNLDSGEQCDDGPSGSATCTPECLLIKSSISGCKYNDLNNNGNIDPGEGKLSGWEIQLITCPYLSEGNPSFPSKDGIGGVSPGSCSVEETTTTVDGCYTFDGLSAGDYGVSEVDKDNWTQTRPAYNTFYFFPLGVEEDKIGVDFANFTDYQGPHCGNGILESGEQCDDGNNVNGDGCSAACNTEGGGGGGVLVSLQINDAGECVVTEDGTYFSWKTNMTSSSRVVCDTEPNPSWGTPPDYGYFLYTDELNLSPRVLNHEVEIPGLVPGENYYCRVISSNSSTTVFEEVICSVPEEEEGEVKGETDVIIPEALPKTGFGPVDNGKGIIVILFAIFLSFVCCYVRMDLGFRSNWK